MVMMMHFINLQYNSLILTEVIHHLRILDEFGLFKIILFDRIDPRSQERMNLLR